MVVLSQFDLHWNCYAQQPNNPKTLGKYYCNFVENGQGVVLKRTISATAPHLGTRRKRRHHRR